MTTLHNRTRATLYRRENLRERAAAILIAEQQIPPDWMTPSTRCNGNCNQGRACDCEPAIEDASTVIEQSPRWRLFLILLSVAIVVGIGVALVRYFVGVNQ